MTETDSFNVIFEVKPQAKCSFCGASMFKKRACSEWRKKGYKTMLKCLNAGCGNKYGYEKGKIDG